MDGGAWWAAVHGVAKSQARLSNLTFTFHFSLSCIGEGNGNPLQCSCLENPRHGGAWWAAVYGVAQSRTRLKRLSSSSSCVLMSILRFQRKALGQLISNFKILDFVPAPLIYSKNLLYLFLQWTLHHI